MPDKRHISNMNRGRSAKRKARAKKVAREPVISVGRSHRLLKPWMEGQSIQADGEVCSVSRVETKVISIAWSKRAPFQKFPNRLFGHKD